MGFTLFIFSDLTEKVLNYSKEECIKHCIYAYHFDKIHDFENSFNLQDFYMDTDRNYIRIFED